MNRITQRFQYQLKRLGWLGILGLALLVGALLFTITILLPAQEQLVSLGIESQKLREDVQLRRQSEVDASPQVKIDAYYSQLPHESSATKLVDQIFAMAIEHNIEPSQATYSMTKSRDARYSSYLITLPVSGSYLDIRQFVAKTLNTLPSAALDGITLTSSNNGERMVDAQLHFTLYLGANS